MSIDIDALVEAVKAMPPAPCATCWMASACEIECQQFKGYVRTGNYFAPPPKPPERK